MLTGQNQFIHVFRVITKLNSHTEALIYCCQCSKIAAGFTNRFVKRHLLIKLKLFPKWTNPIDHLNKRSLHLGLFNQSFFVTDLDIVSTELSNTSKLFINEHPDYQRLTGNKQFPYRIFFTRNIQKYAKYCHQ